MVGELEPKLREELRGALFWQGFGALGADCFVHPSAELPSVLDTLIAEGLAPGAGRPAAAVRRRFTLGQVGQRC